MATVRTSPSQGRGSPEVTGFHDQDTGSIQYVVVDPGTKHAAIIDPVWDFDARHARTDTRSADEILRFVVGGVSESHFVKLRTERDATLLLPDRMLFALQVNLCGGRLPPPESDGRSYFKIPANRFRHP